MIDHSSQLAGSFAACGPVSCHMHAMCSSLSALPQIWLGLAPLIAPER